MDKNFDNQVCNCLGDAIDLLLEAYKPEEINPLVIVESYPRSYGESTSRVFEYCFMGVNGLNIAIYLPTVNSFALIAGQDGNGRPYGFPVAERLDISRFIRS